MSGRGLGEGIEGGYEGGLADAPRCLRGSQGVPSARLGEPPPAPRLSAEAPLQGQRRGQDEASGIDVVRDPELRPEAEFKVL